MCKKNVMTDDDIKKSLIRIFENEANATSESNLTCAYNKLFDRRYIHKKELENQLVEAEARVKLIRAQIAQEERFGSSF